MNAIEEYVFFALLNLFLDEKDRVDLAEYDIGHSIQDGEELTRYFFYIVSAMYKVFINVADNDDASLLDFTYLLNNLVVDKIVEETLNGRKFD